MGVESRSRRTQRGSADLSRFDGQHGIPPSMRTRASARAGKIATRTPRPRRLRLHGTIARQLGIAIVSGRYAPGDLLDNEVASSEQLAVSRTAYREAVRILAAKGLVEARPRVGTRVTPRSRWTLLDPDVLDWIFESPPDRQLLDQLFELRKVIECAAAELAAQRRSSGHLLVMRSALDDMAKHTLATVLGRMADLDFHRALLEATQNAFLISLSTGVSAAIRTTTVFKQRERPLRRDPIPDHSRVFEAIEARDVRRARNAMAELIELARRDTPTRPGRRRRPTRRRRSRT
jgi:DNA-binding FadR family transcriptional regulator